MNDVHVLNGDALAEKFPLSGEIIVCREAMIDGPVDATTSEEFFEERAEYISDNFEAEKATYFTHVKTEFDRLANTPYSSPIHLWFEHDLFCQANLWFLIHFIRENKLPNPVYVVMPPTDVANIWSGFGWMTSDDLQKCFSKKVRLSEADITLGASLWNAYRSNNFHKLEQFCLHPSDAFPMLKEVCKAHMDRFSSNGLGRPQQKLKSIIDSGTKDFNNIFEEFWKTEGIYGFGDLQVKKMLQDL
jgi:hypothetical protein